MNKTVESELESIGHEIEVLRSKGEPMDKELRSRLLKARSWAQASGLSESSIMFLIDQGRADGQGRGL